MAVKPLLSKSILELNLSLNTQYSPVTIQALIAPSRDQFKQVRNLTKLSFLSDTCREILQPRRIRSSLLNPGFSSDAYVVISRFDAFLESEQQFEAYKRLNGVSGGKIDVLNYIMLQNDLDMSNLSMAKLLSACQPLQLSLCAAFKAQTALTPADSIEFARALIQQQIDECCRQIQSEIFNSTVEQLELLMRQTCELIDDAFAVLEHQRGIQLPFNDVYSDNSQLIPLGGAGVVWGSKRAVSNRTFISIQQQMENSTPDQPDESQSLYTNLLQSPVSGQISQYQYTQEAFMTMQGNELQRLPLTLFSAKENSVQQYIATIRSLTELASLKQTESDGEQRQFIFQTIRYSENQINNATNIFTRQFVAALAQFLKASSFTLTILGPPAAANLIGRTCESLIPPKMRQRVLFCRNVQKELACRSRYNGYQMYSDDRSVLLPIKSNCLHYCENCGRINHINQVFSGASIECISGCCSELENVSEYKEVYFIDLCDKAPFKICKDGRFYEFNQQNNCRIANLTCQLLQLQNDLLKAEMVVDTSNAEIMQGQSNHTSFKFISFPSDDDKARKFAEKARAEEWALRILLRGEE